MSDKARALIEEAIHEYQSGDEATRLGSFRDLVTDLLHLASSDEILCAEQNNPPDWDGKLEGLILTGAVGVFYEEKQTQEYEKVSAIPADELPLYIGHEWAWATSKQLFQERIKNEHIH